MSGMKYSKDCISLFDETVKIKMDPQQPMAYGFHHLISYFSCILYLFIQLIYI